ncbi:MAG: FG-GAP repeat protein, partial [Pseudomonadota bacterium]
YKGGYFGTLMVPQSIPGGDFEGDYLAVAGRPPSELVIYQFSSVGEIMDGDINDRFPAGDRMDDDFNDSGFAAAIDAVPRWHDGARERLNSFVVVDSSDRWLTIVDLENSYVDHEMTYVGMDLASVATVTKGAGEWAEGFVVGAHNHCAPGDACPGKAVFVPGTLNTSQVISLHEEVTDNSTIGLNDELGCSVASGMTGGDMPYLAVGSKKRVYIFLYDDTAGHYVFEQCIDGSANGFGTHLFAGKANNDDGIEDLFISSRMKDFDERGRPDEEIDGRYDKVAIVSGSRFVGDPTMPPAACVSVDDIRDDGDLISTLSCKDVPGDEVQCGGSSYFGSSVAVGNVDGEGQPEIAVGVPGASVDGKENAGSVIMYNAVGADPAPVGALRTASPAKETYMGASVAALTIAGEDEFFASMPGEEKFLLFHCSGLGTDTPDHGDNICR